MMATPNVQSILSMVLEEDEHSDTNVDATHSTLNPTAPAFVPSWERASPTVDPSHVQVENYGSGDEEYFAEQYFTEQQYFAADDFSAYDPATGQVYTLPNAGYWMDQEQAMMQQLYHSQAARTAQPQGNTYGRSRPAHQARWA